MRFKIPHSILGAILTWCMLPLPLLPLWGIIQLPSIAGPVDTLLESFHTEDLYTYWTRDVIASESAGVQSDLVLVDVAGIASRGELATLLHTIADAQPRAVALDLIFAPLSMADSAQDKQLVRALERIPRLIIASHCHSDLQGEHREHSFFADSLPNAVEGEAWLAGSVVRSISPIIEENGLPSFSYCIAKELGLDVAATTEPQEISYLPLSVFTWKPAKESMNMSYLRDKVVVVADAQDLRDFHNVPLLTNATGRMPGVMIHLTSVLTMAAARPMHPIPAWQNWLLNLLLLLLLSWLFCIWPFGFDNWYQAGVSLVLTIIVMAFGAYVFAFAHAIISMKIFLIGCPFAGFAKDVADKIMCKCVNL